MKTLVLITICIILAVSCAAQSSTPLVPGTTPALISLDLRDVPLNAALRVLMKYAPVGCMLDPALDQPPYSNVRVTLRVQNGSFNDVMENLKRTYSLATTMSNDMLVVQPLAGQTQPQAQDGLRSAAVADAILPSDLVTIDIPPMPVKNALAMVCPNRGWTFGDDLGRTPMPGARFYQFPREMAAAVVLTAAGLMPPTGNSKVVSYRGKVPGIANNQYMPNVGVPMAQPAAGQQNYYSNQAWNRAYPTHDGIAIAAYQSGNTVLYTILANRALDSVLITRLMTMSGRSYVMGDRDQPVQSELNYAAQQQSVPQAINRSKGVTAQLRNVTLDQALNSLLPACAMQYRKIGMPADPTYQIDPMVQTIGQMLSPALPSPRTPAGPSPPSPSNR